MCYLGVCEYGTWGVGTWCGELGSNPKLALSSKIMWSILHGVARAKYFQSAIKAVILAEGDNCSHGGFIGACMCGGKVLLRSCSEAKCLVNFTCFHSHARFGLDSIPEDWVMKVRQAEEILGYIETVVQ